MKFVEVELQYSEDKVLLDLEAVEYCRKHGLNETRVGMRSGRVHDLHNKEYERLKKLLEALNFQGPLG